MNHQNPIGSALLTPAGFLLAAGGITAGALGARAALRSMEPVPLEPKNGGGSLPAQSYNLNGIYAENATFSAGPQSDIQLDYLGDVGLTDNQEDFQVMMQGGIPQAALVRNLGVRSKDGDVVPLTSFFAKQDGQVGFVIDENFPPVEDQTTITFADGTRAGALAQVGRLVTNLTGQAADLAFSRAYLAVINNNDIFDEPSGTRDRLVKSVLEELDSTQTWPDSPDNLAATDPLRAVWYGMELCAALAYQAAVAPPGS
jgi:hypothetical protein